ncbi:MAG: AmmeMemoRadiSam system protein B [Betaproteobacteria bacterium]|nr:AmmeMemoRadiSam system protein B [Betaproteobacteria bacterium]
MNANLQSPNQGVRPAAVAGTFYPGDAKALLAEVADMLAHTPERLPAPGFPKAVIVPHAGFIYSGPVAAHAYDLLRAARGIVSRVILLGPCHRVGVHGLALPGARAFDTPLGRVPVDQAAVAAVRGMPQVTEFPATHAQEHSLEVQLPFLQSVLGDFSLVPFVVGTASPQQVGEVLERLWGGPETLIVISSDLSHYHAYEIAQEMDGKTVQAILDRDTGIDHQQACGATPISGMLVAAQHHGLRPELLDCRNSGDTAGGRGRVVGYAAFRFAGDEPPAFGAAHGRFLLARAREAIGQKLQGTPVAAVNNAVLAEPANAWMREQHATFVTLKLDGQLRGCVGSLEPHRPLAEDVAQNALAAAFGDGRFKPLSRAEFERIEVEVSILSLPKVVAFADHADLIGQLRPGIDGLILEYGEGGTARRGTFLPQVWEQLPQPEAFLRNLKQKAGLPADTPTSRCRIKRYSVLKWRDSDAI